MSAPYHWIAWSRQLTGRPHTYHGYAFDGDGTVWCGHDHRSVKAADRCAKRLARALSRAGEVKP